MRVVIIGAMLQEITFLLEKLYSYNEVKHYKYTFYEGKLFDKEIIIVASGIGKVASGLLVSALVNYYKEIDLIINVGVSGGVSDKLEIGDIIVANYLKYADVDVTIFPHYEFGQIPNAPTKFPTVIERLKTLEISRPYQVGMIISGDQFYHRKAEVETLINNYFKADNVLCIDMESAALAHSAWFYEVDYLAIRAISDIIGSNLQKDQYNENLEKACVNSNLFLLKVLEKI